MSANKRQALTARNSAWLTWLASLALLFGLTGCVTLADPEASQEYHREVVGVIEGDYTISQSFVSRRPNFNGVWLWLEGEAQATPGAYLYVELYLAHQETPVIVQRLSTARIQRGGMTRFSFPSQANLPDQTYTLRLKTVGEPIKVMGRNEDIYPYGQAVVGETPLNADIAFRPSYAYDWSAALGDLVSALSRAWLILPLAITLLAPGWLLLDLSGLRSRFDPGEQIALAVGLSLAVLPALLVWSTTLGLRWSRAAALAGAAVWTLAWLARLYRLWRLRQSQPGRSSPPVWSLLVIFGLAMGVRLVQIRDLAVPAWVDSVHHLVLTQSILDQGILPSTYEPLIPIDAHTYHAGFHANLAVFTWLSGLSTSDSMLIFAQVLNGLSVFAAYLLTTTFTRSKSAGLAAAVIAGLMTPMPAYYTSWGRYTQLAALLILPALAALARLWISGRGRWAAILLAGVASGGIFLVHYRVMAFTACLLLADWISQTRRAWSANRIFLLRVGSFILACGGAALALTFPWAWPTLSGVFAPIVTANITLPPQRLFADFNWTFLTTALGTPAMVFAGLGLAWGALRRRRLAMGQALWVILLFLLANLAALGVQAGWVLNNLSVEIMLFLPIAVLGGYFYHALISMGRWLLRSWAWIWNGALTAGLSFLAIFGAYQLTPVLNPFTVLLRERERPAMQWIEEHIPTDETVLVSPYLWSSNMYAGQDGGYLISAIAKRKTIPPPVLYGMADPGEFEQINGLCWEVIQQSDNPANLWRVLREQDIRYVYIGARGGVLSARLLYSSPYFVARYQQEGVWIFETTDGE